MKVVRDIGSLILKDFDYSPTSIYDEIIKIFLKRYILREKVIVKIKFNKTKIELKKGREQQFSASCFVENRLINENKEKIPIYLESLKLKCSDQLTVLSSNPRAMGSKKINPDDEGVELFDLKTNEDISPAKYRIIGEVSYKTEGSSEIETVEGLNRIEIKEHVYYPYVIYLILVLFFGFLGGCLNYLLSPTEIKALLYLMGIGLFAGLVAGVMNLLAIMDIEDLKMKHYLNAILIGMAAGLAGPSFFENIALLP